jgi:uncharacterized LabA/DUF88 family protein
LVDFENLVLAFDEAPDNVEGAIDLDPIVDFIEENFGAVIFRRAYADWSKRKFHRYQHELQDNGVEMIHVRRRTPQSKKNGADILLTADAVECLLLRPYINHFAIVSGDSDIGPLITKLKSHGKSVVVVGPDKRSTAAHVIELADRFKFYDDIVTPPQRRRRNTRTRGGSARPRQRTASEVVVEIIKKAGEPLESALLKRELLAEKGFENFSEKALGFKNWTSYLNSIDQVRVNRRGDLGIEVSLRNGGR